MIKGKIYYGIFRNMAGFCKLVAQNWHKNSALVHACSGFFLRSMPTPKDGVIVQLCSRVPFGYARKFSKLINQIQ